MHPILDKKCLFIISKRKIYLYFVKTYQNQRRNELQLFEFIMKCNSLVLKSPRKIH